MYGHAHAGLGWVIGLCAPRSDRRLRGWCVLGAVISDIDTASYLFGLDAYDRWHHTFGHNVFFGALVAAAAVWHHRRCPWRRMALAGSLTALSFLAHLVTDMGLSSWTVPFFWPVIERGWEFEPNLALKHPVNIAIGVVLLAALFILPAIKSPTIVQVVSLRLDRWLMRFYQPRTLSCATCGRTCNLRCDRCGGSMCFRHARVARRFMVVCPGCARTKKEGQGPPAASDP